MAIDMKDSSTMGCAYFSTIDGVLHLSEDISMATLDVADQFLFHVEPTTVLISARAPEEFQTYLEKATIPSDASGGIIFRGLQSSEFSPESARDRLISLQSDSLSPTNIIFSTSTGGDPSGIITGLDQPEAHVFRSLRCGGCLNMNNQVSIGCAGAVLGDLHRRRSAGFLPDGQVSGVLFRVLGARMFSLSSYMFVSADALLALQIVQTELHPNSQAWGSNLSRSSSKESLSVYGLFHHLACTPQGRTYLRQLFLRPVLDLGIIRERQKTISVLLEPNNAEMMACMASILRKIRNLRPALTHLRKGIEFLSAGQSFDKGVWATIQRFATQGLALREALGSLNGGTEPALFKRLVDSLHPAILVAVGDMIDRTIDFQQTKIRQRSSVKQGADPQLDELRRSYDGLNNLLHGIVDQVKLGIPEWARSHIQSCVFLPQLGFATSVDLNPVTGDAMYGGEGTSEGGWEKVFTSEMGACYKNTQMRELDQEYGDLHGQLADREVEVIHGLANRILEHEEVLISASDMCGEFDAVHALALGAEKYNWRAPTVVDGNVIHIKAGRHPLQELVVPTFVPNDCHLASGPADQAHPGESPSRALILTGPNHSGKSVYLKQAAIIVYLAHIGSFVPASQATIGLTDKILTCMSPRESMSGGESAFARDMKQAALATRTSTPRSLVLVDEFGKGTNGDDGSGLLAALLDHFLSLNQDCPRLLVATHFHEIFEGGYLSHHEGFHLAHMDVRVDSDAAQTEDQVTYLFTLALGHSTSSFGARCAALNGVPSAVVERAEGVAQFLAQNEDIGEVCARLSRAEEEELEKADMTARLFVEASFERDEAGQDNDGQEGRRSMKQMLDDMLSMAS
ncbi:hypothetical protein N0V84_005778 [Fusarium piperis]|uniref:DNA mismatch repair protein MSH5 n=1 Tax=Fusarium piperis TaxID=1435070 RepID=A0A9W8WD29_9HYPO|nr:hypothetical protein N0V84_005778 [Fusarium piperis]